MSEADSLESFDPVQQYDDTARFLSSICPEFMNNARYDYGSPEAFACLLHRHPALYDKVQDALELKDFEHVWEVCQIYTEPRRKHFISMDAIPKILSRSSHNFRDLVNGRVRTPFWRLTTTKVVVEDAYPIVREIELHQLMEEPSIPPMLLYDLGSFRRNSTGWVRLQKLFFPGQNTFLVNASATGKTRLLYEGLFQHWGFYVTAHADDLEARALEVALKRPFSGEEQIVSSLPEVSALGFQKLLDYNLRALNRRFSRVVLVHLLVFREFLKTAHAESVLDEEDLRRRWLITQLSYPHLDDKKDIYVQLLEILLFQPWDSIDRELTSVIEEIRPLLPAPIASDGLFIAIDEANAAARQIWSSPGGVAEDHITIRSIIRTWRDRLAQLGCPITIVVAGTQIPSESFPSTVPEWSSWKWTSDTGSFDKRELQKNFIMPFLPPSYAVTPSGEALVQRIWNWCRPRHRLTAVFMVMLLEDKMAHPHCMMDKYIKRLISYDASDASMFTKAEGSSSVKPFFLGVGNLVRGSILSRSATHEVVFHYLLTGKHPPYFGINRLELVTRGVGQFKDADMQVIAMDQPGLTIAAAIWLNSGELKDESLKSFHAFCLYFNHLWQDGEAYSSASFIAWYIAHAFSDGHHLSHIFSIPFPDWLKDTGEAELVILQKDTHGALKEMVVGPSALLPTSPPLGYRAFTPDDVIAWLNQERTGAFCICPPDCGAELIFVLKVKGKFIWVMLRTVGRSIPPEDVDVHSEFAHLTTSGLFSTPTRNTSKRLKETLERLPNSLAPAGSYSILRVLASFPTQPRIPLILNPEAHDGPVAVLKNKTMRETSDKFSHHDLIEGLISSMHEKRSNYEDDAFLPVENALLPKPKPRKGKRKDSTEDQLMGASKTESNESSNRLIRPIPRHAVSRPSTPTLVARLNGETEGGQPISPRPVSKRRKEVGSASKTRKRDNTTVLPRRRSTQSLKKKT